MLKIDNIFVTKLPRQVFLEEHLPVDVLAGQAHALLVEEPRHGADDTLGLGAGGRGTKYTKYTKYTRI